MNNRILVVDDDADTLHLIKVKLSKSGYEVEIARDGKSGFELATHHDADLVILDLMMPGEDGFSTCQRIKSEMDNPPIVLILSGKGEEEHIASAFTHGADDYMIKPFSPSELEERVRVNLIRYK